MVYILISLSHTAGVSFNFETAAFRHQTDGIKSKMDECNFPVYRMPTDHFRDTTQCRCPGYRNFSILTKFQFDNEVASVTLLELGEKDSEPQLRVSVDNCDKKLVLDFNEEGDMEECSYNSTTLEFDLPLIKTNEWNKLAIEVSETTVSVYHNCELLGTQIKTIDRTNCLLKCTNSTLNKLVGAYSKSSCSNGGLAVSNNNYYTLLMSPFIYIYRM